MIYGVKFEKLKKRVVTYSTLNVKLSFELGYDTPTDDLVRHTYDDWGLLQVGVSYVSPPEVQTHFVEVPGMDGALDLTQSLDGLVHYNARVFTGRYKCIKPREEWKSVYTDVLNWIHGQHAQVVFDDDPKHYWEGRFEVGDPEFQNNSMYIPITGTVDAYKYKLNSSLGDWDWDPFVFDTDIARDYDNIEVFDSLDLLVVGYPMPVSPTFICSAPLTLIVNKTSYSLPEGKSVIPGFFIKDEEYIFKFRGTGTVSIYFKGGEL